MEYFTLFLQVLVSSMFDFIFFSVCRISPTLLTGFAPGIECVIRIVERNLFSLKTKPTHRACPGNGVSHVFFIAFLFHLCFISFFFFGLAKYAEGLARDIECVFRVVQRSFFSLETKPTHRACPGNGVSQIICASSRTQTYKHFFASALQTFGIQA